MSREGRWLGLLGGDQNMSIGMWRGNFTVCQGGWG